MQSYQNVSNSQPNSDTRTHHRSCKRLCKVIKMLAIHNNGSNAFSSSQVANAYAKLSKCQQFTTQLLVYLISLCCKRLCKVIKMLAIHNIIFYTNILIVVANAYAKLSKCQQFTTRVVQKVSINQLQTLMQSYQNVSNSQLRCFTLCIQLCCKRLCKVIKMLAIHNFP